MLVDSHCHLDRVALSSYDEDFASFMRHTLAQGIGHLLCVSIDLESWPAMVALVADYPQISISVGVHPNDKERREPSPDELLRLSRSDKVVAIGETGLDYFHGEGDLDWQRERFHAQAPLQLLRHSSFAEDLLKPPQENYFDLVP